jgi:hypothetical protein
VSLKRKARKSLFVTPFPIEGKNQGEVKLGIFHKPNHRVSRYKKRREYSQRETVR